MLCELCGAEVPRTKTVSIDGTVLAVCPSCARFGTETSATTRQRRNLPREVAQRLERRKRRMSERDVYAQAGEEDLADDYAARIRKARESRGWKQVDLGKAINERVTIIAKLEAGAMIPNEDLIRRLERALDIKLKEKVPVVAAKKATAREALTLGDLLEMDEDR